MDNVVNFPKQAVLPFPKPEISRIKRNWYRAMVPKLNPVTGKPNTYPVCFFAQSRTEVIYKWRKWSDNKMSSLRAIKQYQSVSSVRAKV